MIEEHEFAPFVRILGKGKNGTRSLTRAEAEQAMAMILDAQVRPEQLGAFLMLLRVKEEAPEELAGFADAVRQRYAAGVALNADLDWSSYAGKKRRHTWYLLAALCLASHGYRVFMHGAKGHTPGRIYVADMLRLFGLKACASWSEAAEEMDRCGFAYMPIEQLCPPLGEIIQLRPILGLRSPVHTLCRMLNPADAAASIDGVFHPPYGPMHQKAAQLLGVRRNLTLKGDGGEAEIKPDAECRLQWVLDGELHEEDWPRRVPKRFLNEAELADTSLVELWQGKGLSEEHGKGLEKRQGEGQGEESIEHSHEYGYQAIISTLAVSLKLLGDESDHEDLFIKAKQLWSERNIALFSPP